RYALFRAPGLVRQQPGKRTRSATLHIRLLTWMGVELYRAQRDSGSGEIAIGLGRAFVYRSPASVSFLPRRDDSGVHRGREIRVDTGRVRPQKGAAVRHGGIDDMGVFNRPGKIRVKSETLDGIGSSSGFVIGYSVLPG